MNWKSAADFFAMGGYAFYVWGAYSVTAVCLLIDPLLALKRHRQARREVSLRLEEIDES
jgi:heme exporter protein D